MKPGTQAPDIRRIGPYWRVRYPGSHFVLFKHRAQAEHAATLAWAQAAESAACVGMDAGRLIRARHLADRWGPPRLFFVIGGEEVDASGSLDVFRLIFMDPDGQWYPVGRPRCVDCGGRLDAKDAQGKWIDLHDLERRLARTGARGQDFAHGLRRCADCGSLFTDTRYGWRGWPVKAYLAPLRPSTLDTLSQVAFISGIHGALGLILLWALSLSGWWVLPVAPIWFVSSMAAAGWLYDLSHEWDIPQSALDCARRAADGRDRTPREPHALPLFDRAR